MLTINLLPLKTPTMRVQNHPAAYGWLTGMLVLLAGLLISANGGCAHQPAPRAHGRTPAQRVDATVTIYTNCGAGSGVLVDGKHVLTAFHVVNCAKYPDFVPPAAIVVRTVHRTAHVVVNVSAQPGLDLARLELDTEVPNVAPLKVRKAVKGETVCAFAGYPDPATKCARVTGFAEPEKRFFGDVYTDGSYWFGNSGSGVYGFDGVLVGILTRLGWCSEGDGVLWKLTEIKPARTCSGNVSSLTDSTVMP